MGSVAPFLIWLLCIGIAAIMVGLFIQDFEKEGFADLANNPNAVDPEDMLDTSGIPSKQSDISITSCPTGSTAYVTRDGNTNCCEGDVANNTCNGNIMCSLSPSVEGGLQSCSDWITLEWATRSVRFCTDNMPYYFGNLARTPGLEGCSASLTVEDGSAPQDPSKPKCKIYGTLSDELSNVDSCYNINALAMITCPQADSKRLMNSFGRSLPVIFNCSYIPRDGSSNGMPINCYDPERAILFIQNSPNMNADQKSSSISMIRSRRDARFCNYSKTVGTGYKLSGPGISGTIPIEKVIPGERVPSDKAYFAQNGDKIIFLESNSYSGKMNGLIAPGNLSDYDISNNESNRDKLEIVFKKLMPADRSNGWKSIAPTNDYTVSKD